MSAVKQDPFDSPPAPVPFVAENSPIPPALREAIDWAREHGVAEMELPAGRFVLKPAAPRAVPTQADLQEKFGKRAQAVGGYDAEILFAASPSPYIPDDANPISAPSK